jgi:hypothetical protein
MNVFGSALDLLRQTQQQPAKTQPISPTDVAAKISAVMAAASSTFLSAT